MNCSEVDRLEKWQASRKKRGLRNSDWVRQRALWPGGAKLSGTVQTLNLKALREQPEDREVSLSPDEYFAIDDGRDCKLHGQSRREISTWVLVAVVKFG
jgi:hypothetical protein